MRGRPSSQTFGRTLALIFRIVVAVMTIAGSETMRSVHERSEIVRLPMSVLNYYLDEVVELLRDVVRRLLRVCGVATPALTV